ncbi:MAG: hypothetical protein J6L68_03310 [Muribaculaceae bacterium]|nr:hypothetical protein [Muribaculaceae bacterium]
MKKYIIIILSVMISSVGMIFGEVPDDIPSDVPIEEPYKRLHFSNDRENQIFKIARNVCDDVAPKYRSDTLVPVIFSFTKVDRHPIFKNDIITVKFMRDTTDYICHRMGEIRRYGGKTGLRKVRIVPRFVICVFLLEESLEPVIIQDDINRSVIFEPSYAEFRKQYPDTRLEPFTPPATKPGEIILY